MSINSIKWKIISQHASWQSPEERIQDNRRVFNHKLGPHMQEFKQTLKNQNHCEQKRKPVKLSDILFSYPLLAVPCVICQPTVFTSLRTNGLRFIAENQGTSACGQLPAAENTGNTWKILFF